MPQKYDSDFIWNVLQKNRYCILSSHADDGTINTRVMAFTCTRDLRRFYLLTTKDSTKLKDFSKNPSTSLVVFSPAKEIGDYSQIAVKGKISIPSNLHTPEIRDGIRLYAEKTGMLGSDMDNNLLGNFVFLEMHTREVRFNIYLDILHNLPGIKIEF